MGVDAHTVERGRLEEDTDKFTAGLDWHRPWEARSMGSAEIRGYWIRWINIHHT